MTEEEKKESKKVSAKRWRDKNKIKIKESNKIYNSYYYFKNKKEKIFLSEEERNIRRKESDKIWRDKNKEYFKSYRDENLEDINNYQKEYYNKNRVELNKKIQERKKIRYQNDLNYRVKVLVRGLIRKSLKRDGFTKSSKTQEILGCSFVEFKNYLESKFEIWMCWENRGLYNGDFNHGWDIDHIIPLSTSCCEQDTIKLNHYNNLQPLCSKVNRDIKRDKIDYEIN
jgi:hypothetical protein